ncbi:TonB-dependent receptor domain-containing protein [Melioribacteraceae bacterium 4301-Me]|uniref:TonB-dependent receptor n=1 Tax=Pyranulibacter aquaticus TaxID=3163344 RepID=UPI003594A07B
MHYYQKPLNNYVYLWGIFFFLIVFNSLSFSQNGIIKGVIKDAKTGENLVGANIIVIGTNIGTTANINGEYILRVPTGHRVIQVSFIGYKTVRKEFDIKSSETISQDFLLQNDIIGTQEVVVVGTRTQDRTVVNSPVPIDIITAKEIEQSGFSLTTDLLKSLVPSYNAPQTSIVDGSDHVRPATLRGLNPDQVLVLINGKRRYTSALVNVNGTIGRGSSGTDLNAIPASAIERIEVLRDGASAQYGSDAIAGVINIILKSKKGFDVSTSYGEYLTGYTRGYSESEGNLPGENASTYSWDGKTEKVNIQDGISKNVHLGYGFDVNGGVVYLSGDYRKHNFTNRSGIDYRQQYFTINGQPDPREATFGRLNHRFGDADLEDIGVFLNSSIPISEGTEFYSFGGYSFRKGSAGGFYRRSLDDRNVRAIYPDGFLPMIDTKIYDGSFAAGIKGTLGDLIYDAAEVFGGNSFNFYVDNSLNASYGAQSPTSFFAGALKFYQSTTTIDFSKQIDIGTENPLNIAAGLEFRWENYQIAAGEPKSYLDGGVPILDGPNAGKPAPVGSQVFPGFAPSNEQNQSRTNVGVYLDLENQINAQLSLGAAARFENYSDFGSTLTGKFDARYEFIPNLALRGAISTGFRAPSLSQEYFSSIATTFIGGVPFELGTFPVSSAVAKALGAKDLTAEKSVNISGGLTFSDNNLAITIDVYEINLKDRIVLTENFTGSGIANFLQSKGVNATGGRFFTNALDTKTKGLDITAKYGLLLGDGTLRFMASLNFNKTDITNKDKIQTPAQLQSITTIPLLGRVEQGRFERGQPLSSWNFQANYSIYNFSFMARLQRYGQVTSFNNDPTRDQTFSPIWLVDAEASYKIIKELTIAIGANNLFDVYPDKVIKINSFNGILPFTSMLPSGFNGRYVYSRLSFSI